jgi:arylsulfatase
VVGELEELWFSEAERNQVLPIDDGLVNRFGALVPPAYPPGNDATFLPGAGPVRDESLPPLFGGFRITAEVAVSVGAPDGVVFAVGDWNGGYALYVIGDNTYFTFSRAGQVIEVSSPANLRPGNHSLGVAYTVGHGAQSSFTLLHTEEVLATTFFEGHLPLALQHGGTALRIGYDAGLPVSERYQPPAAFTGTVASVRFETPGRPVDVVSEARAALHSD